jgi:pyrroloquinoline quinone (PQQ) biosynthesis protein C
MSGTSVSNADLEEFARDLRLRANRQHQMPQAQRLLSLPLSVERARFSTLQRAHWNVNRRDCWAYAQARAPLDIKKLIWAHEMDELAGNQVRGVEDHYALRIREAEVLGLTLEDFRNTPMEPGTRVCTYAWLYLVMNSPWLKGLAACAALEISNSSKWVDGGGGSYRMGKRFEQELGIPFEKQVNAKEHAEVDVEHAHMLMQVAERHATTKEKLALMMEGVVETFELQTIWKGILADMMEAIPGPERSGAAMPASENRMSQPT